MRRELFVRCVSASLTVLLLLPAAISCSSVEEFLEQAEDVAKDVGDVAKDVVEEAKELIPSAGAGSRTVDRPPRPTGTISMGPAKLLGSQVVESAGGTVAVNQPGDALDGLEIQVPSGSYTGARQFNVSSAPISGHSFGEYFDPLTPLIMVENGGECSEEPMTVRIPCEVPQDHFAMAFFYDEATDTLEGMPLAGVENGAIVVVTRHFSWFTISAIENEVLDGLIAKGLDSGFRPGADDWQFVNRGSYVARIGQCAGQSLTALWYFCERPDGPAPFLWGLYDNNGRRPATPSFDADDSYGYRFASRVQAELKAAWNGFENRFFAGLIGVNDELTFRAFAYGMVLTREPQLVYVFSNAGGAHAMIIYRLDRRQMYIADPNYPGNTERRIEYSGGKFTPYHSGANADEIAAGNGKAYERIGYFGKTATVDWKNIAAHWLEFKDGTIGDDVFPAYNLVVMKGDGTHEPLVDGYVSEEKKIDISETVGIPNGGSLGVFRDGVALEWDADGKIELREGNNLLGILVVGDIDSNPQSSTFKYVDFRYVNVVYGEEEPAPSEIPFVSLFCEGYPGQAYDSFRDANNYSGPGWGGLKTDNYVPITWNGLNFSGSLTLQPYEGATGTGSVVVSGHLSRSPDPAYPVLLTVNYTREYNSVYYDWDEAGLVSYTITDIPMDCNEFVFNTKHEMRSKYLESSGVAMQKYLTSLEYRLDRTWLGDEPSVFPDEHWTYTDTTCSAPTGVPGETQAEFTIILQWPEE